jgi:hypothetical protein
MAGKVQIKIDIESESVEFATDRTLTLTEKTRLLKKELQTIPEGTKEWHVLNNTFNDTKDALDRVNTKSRDIFGTMSLLPGPIGQVSNTLEQTIDAFKIFGSLKTSDLKAQLGNLLTDFKDVAKTIGNLTGITKIYTTLNNALASSFVKVGVGETAAAAGARAFSAALVATGVGALIVALGLAVNALMEMANAESDAEIATRELNDELERQNTLLDLNAKDAARRRKVTIAEMRADGKTEKEIRQFNLKEAQKDFDEAKAAEVEAVKTYNDALGKADEEGLKKAGENLDKRQQAVKDALSNIKVLAAEYRTEENKEQESANQKANQKAEQQRDKDKAAKEKELEELKKGNKEALQETRDARVNETNEVNEKYDNLVMLAQKYGQSTKDLEAGRIAALLKLTEKYKEEDEKKEKEKQDKKLENARKLLEIEKDLHESTVDAMKAGRDKELVIIKDAGQEKIDAFKNELMEAEKLKLLTAEQVAEKLAIFTKNVNDAIAAQIEDLDKKDLSEKLDEKLQLLQIQSEGLLAGTQAYFDNRRAIINASEQKELEDTELTEAEKTAIQEKYARQRDQLRKEEVASLGQTISATISAISSVTSALASGYDEEAKTSEEAFEKRKKLQIATAVMSAASGVVQILTQPSTLPSPFDWIVKGINALALGVATAINIKKIKATKFEAPDAGGSEAASAVTGTKFANGGILNGPRHSQGGIRTKYGELEGGEFVINRRATQSFLPILSAINSTGVRKYENGGMTASIDQLQSMLMNQPAQIVKTYVVASEISSQQEADKRLRDLAKI